jgi:hypothetical protein
MTSDHHLVLILRRLDEIERKLDHMLDKLRTPRLFGTPRQSPKEGLRPVLPSVDANLLAGPCSGRHYLLTDRRQFGIGGLIVLPDPFAAPIAS